MLKKYRRIWLKEVLAFLISKTHFADRRIFWIMGFVYFEVRIAEIMREQVSDRPAWTPPVVAFWRSPRMTALELDF